jgi:hypothetical protein
MPAIMHCLPAMPASGWMVVLHSHTMPGSAESSRSSSDSGGEDTEEEAEDTVRVLAGVSASHHGTGRRQVAAGASAGAGAAASSKVRHPGAAPACRHRRADACPHPTDLPLAWWQVDDGTGDGDETDEMEGEEQARMVRALQRAAASRGQQWQRNSEDVTAGARAQRAREVSWPRVKVCCLCSWHLPCPLVVADARVPCWRPHQRGRRIRDVESSHR